ncbi:thioredoxin family protein [Pontibacter ruber]|uniref:Thioredoxin family protein n=1 Tax=Pontibacter ruber TaxID=1343895 RepID=A0ABW5CRK8_9BACT|nr:thioredoxin family protein [Pontibacter ruber]
MVTTTEQIQQLVNPLTYQAYRDLVERLVEENATTGEEQSEQRVAYTKLNLQRMKRVEKQFKLAPALQEALAEAQPNWQWLVLVESWCGDGAQLLPAIAGIAAEFPSIELTVLLRDQNPQLMDTCLTNGSRSIPKLICVNRETGDRVFTWGPRPAAIQEQFLKYKAQNPQAEDAAVQLHTWYAKDRSEALQQDLLQLVLKSTATAGSEIDLS